MAKMETDRIEIRKKGQRVDWHVFADEETLDIRGKIKDIGGNNLTIKGEIHITFNDNGAYTFVKGKGITEIKSPNIRPYPRIRD